MNPKTALSVMIRVFAVLLFASAISLDSVFVFGYVEPSGYAVGTKGAALAWQLIGDLIVVGVLWIYTRDLSSWLIGCFDRPLIAGLRTAGLITAALSTGSLAVSIYSLFHLSEISSRDLVYVNSANGSIEMHASTIVFFALAIALIFVAPKIDDLIKQDEKIKNMRSEIESEQT